MVDMVQVYYGADIGFEARDLDRVGGKNTAANA
jgi:hypothetical protein